MHSSPSEEKDQPAYVVVSYIPLLMPNEQDRKLLDLRNNEKIIKRLAKRMDQGSPNVADGLAWSHDFEPIFIFKRISRKLAKHLEEWSEHEPEYWFDMVWAEKNGMYAVVLMPKLDRSIDRFRLRAKVQFNTDIPHDAKFTLFFRPLQFVSQPGLPTTFHQIKDRIKNRIRVGFINGTHDKEPYWLNKGALFNWRKAEPHMNTYLDGIFAGSKRKE